MSYFFGLVQGLTFGVVVGVWVGFLYDDHLDRSERS